MPSEETLLFIAEWFDPQPMLKRQYIFKYFVETHSCEMFDLKNNRLFLKKSPLNSSISKSDMVIGSRILIYGREIDIVDYGDKTTQNKLAIDMESAACILPINIYKDWGTIIDSLQKNGLLLRKIKTLYMNDDIINNLTNIISTSNIDYNILKNNLSLLVNVAGPGGSKLLNDTISDINKEYGIDGVITASSSSEVTNLLDLINKLNNTATLDNCTCCVIKPHCIKSGNFGKILDIIISQGYEISAMETMQFDRATSEEFLEIYKDVIPDYSDHVIQLCSGISIAMELRAEDAVINFRDTCGPWDVQMAKELRPNTLRAKFGLDNIRSAIYCTDLPSDGVVDCEYCFSIM